MIPEKYAEMGFEITRFGVQSSVLRFEHKPIFVFSSGNNIDAGFLTRICDIYLKITGNRRSAA